MQTITLKIDEKIKDKFLWLLNHFSKNEVKIQVAFTSKQLPKLFPIMWGNVGDISYFLLHKLAVLHNICGTELMVEHF